MLKVATLLTGIIFVAAMFFLPGPEEKRVALVIGNAAYTNISPLKTPANDARSVSEALKRSGFEVIIGTDLRRNKLERLIRTFSKKLRNADVGLFYYAGKLIQLNGKNYLSPVNMGQWTNSDVEFHTIALDPVLSEMNLLARMNLVFFDACKDSAATTKTNKAKTVISRQPSAKCRGISPISNKQKMMIVYSSRPGATKPEMPGKTSPFSVAVAKQIQVHGNGLSTVVANIREEVMAQTGHRQIPWEDSSLKRQFVFTTKPVSESIQVSDTEPSEPPVTKKTATVQPEHQSTHASDSNSSKTVKPLVKQVRFDKKTTFDFRSQSEKNKLKNANYRQKVAENTETKIVQAARNKAAGQDQKPKQEIKAENVKAAEEPVRIAALQPTSVKGKVVKIEKVDTGTTSTNNEQSAISSESSEKSRIEHKSRDLHKIAKADLDNNDISAPDNIKIKVSESEIKSQLQEKLSALQCYHGRIDGIWGRRSKRALRKFTRATSQDLPRKPNSALIEIVASYSGPVCSVRCPRGISVTKTGECGDNITTSSVTAAVHENPVPPGHRRELLSKKSKKAVKKRRVKRKKRVRRNYVKRRRAVRSRAVRKRYYRRRAPKVYLVRGGYIVIH